MPVENKNENKLDWNKLLSVLEEIKNSILKMLDFYSTRKEDSILEIYNLTTSTQEQTLYPPVIKGKRAYWFYIQMDNFDSTNDIKIGINSTSDQGILLKAGKSKTIGYNNLKIHHIRYEAVAGTPSLQIICARPKFE